MMSAFRNTWWKKDTIQKLFVAQVLANSSIGNAHPDDLPVYGPDSMIPSVVDAKLPEGTHDSGRSANAGFPGKESCGRRFKFDLEVRSV